MMRVRMKADRERQRSAARLIAVLNKVRRDVDGDDVAS